MWTSPVNEMSFTLVKGFIQSMRLACSRQKPSGSLTDWSYIAWYLAASTQGPAGEFWWNGEHVALPA